MTRTQGLSRPTGAWGTAWTKYYYRHFYPVGKEQAWGIQEFRTALSDPAGFARDGPFWTAHYDRVRWREAGRCRRMVLGGRPRFCRQQMSTAAMSGEALGCGKRARIRLRDPAPEWEARSGSSNDRIHGRPRGRCSSVPDRTWSAGA